MRERGVERKKNIRLAKVNSEKRNKILLFFFTIELQCDSTFRIAL